MKALPNDAVGDALRRYVELGSDLTREMEMEFFVSAPSKESVDKIAERASLKGFNTSVESDEGTNEWTCYCSLTLIPQYDNVVEIEDILADLAKDYGGFPDGFGSWGNAQ